MINVVSLKGDADYTSVAHACRSVNSSFSAPAIVLARMEEFCENVRIEESFIRLIGEAAARTVITSDCGTVLTVAGDSVEVENITLRASEGDDALRIDGENCRISGLILKGNTVVNGSACFYDCRFDGNVTVNGKARFVNCEGTSIPVSSDMPAVNRRQTWFLCGDSTMADYPISESPRTGWGQALKTLAPDSVIVENCAVCGRSSKSFIAEKRLGFIELCLRKGDLLLIQFSHNDEKPDVERATSPRTTYPLYLEMYIDAAKRQGACPVLMTPVARRHFDETGKPKHTHGLYPSAMKDIAYTRGVVLLDMEKATEDILSSMAADETKALYCHIPAGHPNFPDGANDDTHLSKEGALRYAKSALDLMKENRII